MRGIDGEGAFSVSRSRGVRAGDAAERDERALPRRMVNKQIEAPSPDETDEAQSPS